MGIETVSQDDPGSTSADTTRWGVIVVASGACTLTSGMKNATSESTIGYVYERTGAAAGTLLQSGLFSSNIVTFNQALTSGTTYFVVADKGGSSHNHTYVNTTSYPFNGTYINLTGRVIIGVAEATNQCFDFKNVSVTFPEDVTVTPTALALSLTGPAPTPSIIPTSNVQGLTLAVNAVTFNIREELPKDFQVVDGSGTIGTQYLRKKYYSTGDLVVLAGRDF